MVAGTYIQTFASRQPYFCLLYKLNQSDAQPEYFKLVNMCHLHPSTYFTTTMFDVSTATFTKKIIMPCSDKFIFHVAIRWWMAWGDLCLTNIVIWGGAIDGTSLEYIVPKRSRKYCIFMVNGNIMPHMHCWKLAHWTIKQRLPVSLNAM